MFCLTMKQFHAADKELIISLQSLESNILSNLVTHIRNIQLLSYPSDS